MNDDLLTDEPLHEMFERRAQRGTADGLRHSILGATASTAQRGPALRVLSGGRTTVRLLAVAALLAASVAGSQLLAGRSQPLPPTQPFASFAVPSDLRPVDGVPTDSPSIKAPTETESPASPSAQPAAVVVEPPLFAPSFTYRSVEGVPTAAPILGGGIIAFTIGGPGSEALTSGATASNMYPRTDAGLPLPDTHGIAVSHLYPGAFVHGCQAGDRVAVRLDQAGLVDDLRSVAGVAFESPTRTTFDGRPAVVLNVDPSHNRCDSAHIHTMPEPLLAGSDSSIAFTVPSRVIVTKVGGATVLLQAWAASSDELAAWLPTANRFLDGVHFTDDTAP